MPEVLPTAEGGVFVVLVKAVYHGLYETSLDFESQPEELDSAIHALLLLKIQSVFHFVEPLLVAVFLVQAGCGPPIFVPSHAEVPPADFL